MVLLATNPDTSDIIYSILGIVVFLIIYFHAFRVANDKIWINITCILFVSTILAFISAAASVLFVYAAAFCCRLGNPQKALVGLVLITLWIAILSWYLKSHLYFYGPAIIFSWVVGGMNIFQHEMHIKRQELNLSKLEIQHLARTAERERIARDLHDLIGHTFSVLTLKAELAGKIINRDIEATRREILEMETISRDALKQIREVITGFRSNDLITELAHAKYILDSNGINFEYQFDSFEIADEINKEIAIIMKELVTNVLKHADATKVEVSITQSDDHILFGFRDNGSGFNLPSNQGFGLKGIMERIENLYGSFSIESKAGTDISIRVPLEKIS